jgi:threonine synthase
VSAWRGVLAEFAAHLPLSPATPALSLAEGNTPLITSPVLARWAGVRELWLKCEGSNPTGSFKDRGMVVAVARALERGADTVICASTGNTAASAAAYAARAGIAAVVVLPRSGVAAGKLLQAFAHGARVVAVDGGFDQALDVARALAARYPATLVNSVNPDRIAGQQTAAYEIWDQLGAAPDILALPVGNGGNITAYWAGFGVRAGRHAGALLPRIVGAQAEGAAPLVRGRPVEQPETAASAIRIGRPASWEAAVKAVRESRGALGRSSP